MKQGQGDIVVCAADSSVQTTDEVDLFEAHRGHWWLLHTKPRQEKALAADLLERDIHCYLPLVDRTHRHGNRKVRVSLPLFPSYLFLCGTDDDRYESLMTHRAACAIDVCDQERLRRELRQIARVIASDQPVDLYPRLRRGQRCRIVQGSLRGVEGVVIRRQDVCRIYLGVKMLGQSAEIEIDPSYVEAID